MGIDFLMQLILHSLAMIVYFCGAKVIAVIIKAMKALHSVY